MKKILVVLAAAVMSASLSYAQKSWESNPCASKGEIVAPVLSSSIVDEIVIVSDNPGEWKFSASVETEGGKEIVSIVMDAPQPCAPARFNVYFTFPQKGVFNTWTSDVSCGTHLDPFWGGSNNSSALAFRMPLYEYFDDNDTNRLTIACSESFRRVEAALGVMEEGCDICSELRFFREAEAPMSHYETKILLDGRRVFWGKTIQDGVKWMMEEKGLQALEAPEAAFEPLYSTWYQFHQNVTDKAVAEECKLAAELGMKTVILDDGWQTEDGNRGYAFCGDWKPTPKKFPDMASHVAAVQKLGMKYMIWYSVPYVGFNSEAYAKFEGKYLYTEHGLGCSVLDPRFPEVREHLVNIYVNALKDWNLDGFKLDFIDSFGLRGEDPAVKENYAGRDIMNVNEAVNVLMKEVSSALKAIKPDILLEFRQQYIGPAIRQYGNMFRAADCPGNAKDNRMRIASLRLTSGSTAVHSDMIEWNLKETPENVGRAIINSIFGVVQYSAMLKDIPQEHLEVIKKWISFTSEHRETL
ncbi:MAG: alpha-galactosidase, partial [Bacteroidales bacterium]|nr:alpha-galactosidase [Bacteroidales bacterium]